MSVLGSDAGFIHARQKLCQLNYTPSSLLSLFFGGGRWGRVMHGWNQVCAVLPIWRSEDVL